MKIEGGITIMAKIRLTDKKFLNEIYGVIGLIGSIASIIALALTLPGWWKFFSLVALFVPLIIIFIIRCYVNNKKSAHFRINQTEINVIEGNIFQRDSETINVIPFNEYFDTLVDNNVISEASLNGKYIKDYWNGKIDELNTLIQQSDILKKSIIGTNQKRKSGNKQKYELGSVIAIDNFVLTAFSHFDDSNRAYLSFSDYLNFLVSFWKHIDVVYNGKTINIPVFGSG